MSDEHFPDSGLLQLDLPVGLVLLDRRRRARPARAAQPQPVLDDNGLVSYRNRRFQ